MDTIEASLASLVGSGRLSVAAEGRWTVAPKTGAADAIKRLFGE